MKRLLIAAGVAGVCLSTVVGEASDRFRVRYRVQYSGGAYLGYPSTTKYSVSYYPQVGGQYGAPGASVGGNGQPVYPAYLGNGYTVNAQPGPYTSYGYNYSQKFHYNYPNGERIHGQGVYGSYASSGCNNCDGGNGIGVTVKNRLNGNGQISGQAYPSGAPMGPGAVMAPEYIAPETYQAAPVNSAPSNGVTVPPPAAPPVPKTKVVPQPVNPKTARGNASGVPVLVADEQEVSN